jgi:pilus assembly protein Flp/PilA
MVDGTVAKGQGLVEYALILLLVVLVVIVMLALFGPAVGNMYSTITSSI